ncbi:MAG: SapC family protein, partial [Hyphococcus sp.]
MSETQGTPELTGKMFLFEKPELLSKEQYGDLGMTDPGKRFDFCSKVRAIPITVTEVPVASRDYPIIFLSKENPVLLAVVGLIDDVNLFVDENGAWETHRYIPGYARRYPFGLANQTGTDNMAIVIDTA